MAIDRKLFLCLASMVILTASPAYCAPQNWNFGWPTQPESIPRLPAANVFIPPNPFSLPTVTALPQRNVAMPAVQPRTTLQKQDMVPESRLFSGPASNVQQPQASNLKKKTTLNWYYY